MMIAVPLFGSRVSPRFDCASNVLIARLNAGAVSSREVLTPAQTGAWTMASLLAERSVQVLICGGVPCHLRALFAERGIRIITGIVGEADDALAAFAAGKLQPGVPGHCGGRRRRGKSSNGPRWLED